MKQLADARSEAAMLGTDSLQVHSWTCKGTEQSTKRFQLAGKRLLKKCHI